MTRDEAETRAAELNAESGGHNWFVRELEDGGFDAVKVSVPGFKPNAPLKTTTESNPRPRDADDPRTSFDQNVGGPWGGAF
jgi:hypothetical protein